MATLVVVGGNIFFANLDGGELLTLYVNYTINMLVHGNVTLPCTSILYICGNGVAPFVDTCHTVSQSLIN